MAYANIDADRKLQNALAMVCRHCGVVHTSETQQINCDVKQWELDEAFADYQTGTMLDILERRSGN